MDEEDNKIQKEEKVTLEDYKYILIGGGVFVFLIVIWLIKRVNEK